MNTLIDSMKFESGITAEIHQDCDVEQPFDDDAAVRIVVLHRRYIDPSKGKCGRDPDEFAKWESENQDNWFIIPLYMYDHSGTAYRVGRSNPFHCPWDSGRVGIIALKRSEWGDGQSTDDQLETYAQSIATEYTSWANGDCYGYVLRDSQGNEIDSCWGFIGRDAVDAEAKAAAKAHAPPSPA